jgi:hypothetical protein
MRVRCGTICLIALFVALSAQESNKETGESKQLAPGAPYLRLQTTLVGRGGAYVNLPVKLATLATSSCGSIGLGMWI